ncbi:MAG: TIGR03663 family protein [Planctomycetes bacterium]|nr:TIGR03663 family protein [Planctomycetota bacterium]
MLRLASLDNRPMHCDEAGQALKFRLLLEDGRYEYDPFEYHGPTLNYFTLPIARLVSADTLADLTEVHVRLLPALFGIALVAMVWLLRDELGRGAALCAAGLTAVSPAMVFYSRYYIHEMLLVTFTFGAIVALRRAQKGSQRHLSAGKRVLTPFLPPFLPWAMLGMCLAMMHATKETCIIPIAAMMLALAVEIGWATLSARRFPTSPAVASLGNVNIRWMAVGCLVALLVAVGVSALFFSSFCSHPDGIADSYNTFSHYFDRAAGEGSAGRHAQPWDDYLRRLFWWPGSDGLIWTESLIGVLAVVGLIAGMIGRGIRPESRSLVRFLSVYTVAMTVVYSALTYKTPWCALGFLHGMILLAGVGATVVVRLMPGHLAKALMIGLLAAATYHLAWQGYGASFVAHEDRNNPYLHTPTSSDVLHLVADVEQLAASHPRGNGMYIQVICPDDDFWPLPWYFRHFTQVGFFRAPPELPAAPLVIFGPGLKAPVPKSLLRGNAPAGERTAYLPVVPEGARKRWELRKYVPLSMVVQDELWSDYWKKQNARIWKGRTPARLRPDTGDDALRLANRLRTIATAFPDGKATHIQVICPEHDYWPLPWYLHDFTRVQWLDRIPQEPPTRESLPAPLIVTQPAIEPGLDKYLFQDPPPGYQFQYAADRPKEGDPDWRLRRETLMLLFLQVTLRDRYLVDAPEE